MLRLDARLVMLIQKDSREKVTTFHFPLSTLNDWILLIGKIGRQLIVL